jgi:plastocyanin|tara:strand:+ start:1283 stop:2983 length:1701 start_codon:yes stop_codon:yes gene_type:complete
MSFDITKYFRRGQNSTIEFRNGTNLSYAGPSYSLVEAGTELDRWYVGSYFGVEYTIACDVNSERKEVIKAMATASTSEANIVVYGRSNLGDDLLQLEVEVTDSYFKLMAYPRVQDDSTAISGAKVIYSANYYATQNEPTATLLGSNVAANAPVYTLNPSTTNTGELGQTVTIELITSNVLAGTVLPFTITGVQSADIGGLNLTGAFIVGTTDIISFPITVDLSSEGSEVLKLELDNKQANTSIVIQDTSTTPSITYGLVTSAASVNEGESFTITLNAENVADGTLIGYTITGVDASDIGNAALTGTFEIGTTESIVYTATEDAFTDGPETFQMSIDGTDTVVEVAIGDTSLSPIIPSYTLGSSSTTVNEGGVFTITLSTSNVDNGTVLPYTISGVTGADIGGAALTGNFVVGTTDSLTFTATADATTEGDEGFVISLDNGESTFNLAIVDTSTTPGNSYTIATSNSGSGAYTLNGTDRLGPVSGSNQTVTINVNDTVTFSMNAPGHPFYIKNANSTGTGNIVTNPLATGQGASSSGNVVWTPSAVGTYHYNCQFHGAMHGLIVVQS